MDIYCSQLGQDGVRVKKKTTEDGDFYVVEGFSADAVRHLGTYTTEGDARDAFIFHKKSL